MDSTDNSHTRQQGNASAYVIFGLNMALSLAAMYLVMFTMIDTGADFRNNLNMFYMALSMVAPMGLLMLLTMPAMYSKKRTNAFIYAGLIGLFGLSIAGTRNQAAIGDAQFISSMIPHHSGAILMCREAKLSDPELMQLCDDISRGQRREIQQMNAIQARLEHPTDR